MLKSLLSLFYGQPGEVITAVTISPVEPTVAMSVNFLVGSVKQRNGRLQRNGFRLSQTIMILSWCDESTPEGSESSHVFKFPLQAASGVDPLRSLGNSVVKS